MSIRIVAEAHARAEDINRLGEGIEADSAPRVGPGDRRDLTYFVRDAAGNIIGGVHGNTSGGWLYVGALWVSETLRGTGPGRALMARAE